MRGVGGGGRSKWSAWTLLVLLAGACARTAPPQVAPEDPVAADARAGIVSDALAEILVDHWRWTLATSPELATSLGIAGHDHEVGDPSVAAADRAHAARAVFRARLDALDAAALTPRDARFAGLLAEQLDAALAARACRMETWALSPRSNAMVDLFYAVDLQPVGDDAAVDALLLRMAAWEAALPAHLDALREGVAEGRVATAASLERVIAQIDGQLATEDAAWPVVRRVAEARPARADAVRAAVASRVRPGLVVYRDMLAGEVLPAARDDARSGVVHLPDGTACYAARVQGYVGTSRSPEALHALGRDAMASVHAEFRALGAEAFGESDLERIFERLRSDPALRFEDAPTMLHTADDALRRAEAAVPAWFGRLPATPCRVEEIPAHEAPYTTVAYYRPPTAGGAKPGEYFVNTHAPRTRPVHEAEVLAFHEAVPGHHLQIALAQELPGVPAFHRYEGSTAFVEGWALYAERLADEMGLYGGPEDRLGMLAFDAWRAGRLVVDTGIHHLGWSRSQAVDYLARNTPLALNNIDNEVDRYVSWPGQALAYKVGQLEILALRREAEAALGDGFDVAAFHDVVLGEGALSLPALRARVEAWVRDEVSRTPADGVRGAPFD